MTMKLRYLLIGLLFGIVTQTHAFDLHKNFAASTVATAPSPATSGTSLVVASGEGAKFPTPPFNATVWPAGSAPSTSNAEIVRVTGISTDTLTITRTQESTSARTIVTGDIIAATITAKVIKDIEDADALKAPIASPTFTGTATMPTASIATETIGSSTLTNNIGSPQTVGNTNVVDMAITASFATTNTITANLAFAHATNGVDGLLVAKVRKFMVPSGGPYTLTIPGWRTNVYSAVPPALTNGTITFMHLTCDGPTSSAALQTNVYVSFEYFK